MVTQQLTNPRVTKLVEKFPPLFRERERELELRDKPKIKFQELIPQPVHLAHSLILVEKVSPLHTPFAVLCLTEVTGRTCNGDSGSFTGARAGDRGRQWVQHGITSFGIPVRAAPSRFACNLPAVTSKENCRNVPGTSCLGN